MPSLLVRRSQHRVGTEPRRQKSSVKTHHRPPRRKSRPGVIKAIQESERAMSVVRIFLDYSPAQLEKSGQATARCISDIVRTQVRYCEIREAAAT